MNEQIDMNLTKKIDIDSGKYVNIHIDIILYTFINMKILIIIKSIFQRKRGKLRFKRV